MAKTHKQIIAEANRVIGEIDQLFADAEHWNRNRRQNEAPIDVDGDGQLRKLRQQLRVIVDPSESAIK